MAKLAFYTQTHCAEKYVRRTIESILNQTYQNFVYYISDDGSTDATPDIIMEYANKDARIVPCISKPIGIMKLYIESINRIWDESGAEYFSILDHDDVYAPEFAEKMIFQMEKEDLDMAICGSVFTDLNSGKPMGIRAPIQNMLIKKQDQADLFPQLFQYYRALWGKIYKIDFIKRNNIHFRNIQSYGTDTVFCLDCARFAKRFLVLHEVLHTYYMHNTSISYNFSDKRSEDNFMLYHEGMNYLEQVKGTSVGNISFILSVYLQAVIDNICLICKSKLTLKQILHNLHKAVTDEKFLSNWRYCLQICENTHDEGSVIMQTKINLEQQIVLALENIILSDAKYKKEIFDIVCVFCPEIKDFFDENNIKSLLSLDLISFAFFSRDFEKTYKLIEQSYDSDCLASNKMLYNLKVYLTVVLHKEDKIVQDYLEENRRKTDSLTIKRIGFISEHTDALKGQPEITGPIVSEFSVDKIQSFDELMDFVRNRSEENILQYGFKYFLEKKKISKVDGVKKRSLLYKYFVENCFLGIFKSQFVGGGMLTDSIKDIKTHIEDYVWFYQLLEDEESRTTLFYILMYRIFLNKKYLLFSATEDIQYFTPNIIPKRENHVFVDCGAFTGDSAMDFIKYCTENENYKRIYCYEPAPDNFARVVETMGNYHDIICKNKGVFDERTQMHFTSNMPSAGNRINPEGDKIVETVDIDSDIKEPVTFIKMDIESAEPNALLGARHHIMEDKPILAICVYHTVTDLLKIPQIIYGMNRNQKFYLRHHGQNSPEEIVFYALPCESEKVCDADTEQRAEAEKEAANVLLQQIEQLAGLYDTIGEGIIFMGEKLKQGELNEVYKMMSVIHEGLEQELSFVQFLQENSRISE